MPTAAASTPELLPDVDLSSFDFSAEPASSDKADPGRVDFSFDDIDLSAEDQETSALAAGTDEVDTKLDLAPLMEAMNETMQGLRGNEFGPRHQ